MKKQLLYLFAFLLLPLSLCAQEPPAHRVVYLWDVTYSTHGGRMDSTKAQKKEKNLHNSKKSCTFAPVFSTSYIVKSYINKGAWR